MKDNLVYCISDVHGHLDNLMRFVETLNENDLVYVLGDVIDKGDNSIDVLKFVMHDKRFNMLLGNHEYMMFQYLNEDIDSYDKKVAYDNWVIWNEGYNTLKQYNALSENEQIEIKEYIRKLPINYPDVNVKEKHFYLVHSCPRGNTIVNMEDLSYDEDLIASYVWDRVSPFNAKQIDNRVVISGHTPVQSYLGFEATVKPVFDGADIKDAKYIDIDGGLAINLDNSRLIALCLDDLSYSLF